jgi:hypothetical protein
MSIETGTTEILWVFPADVVESPLLCDAVMTCSNLDLITLVAQWDAGVLLGHFVRVLNTLVTDR